MVPGVDAREDGMKGRVAVVTGASRGLGRAMAQRFAREGASVALIDMKQHWAEAAAGEIVAAGGTAFGLGQDVGDRAGLRTALDHVADRFGRLDVMVNNAMWNRYEPIEAIEEATFDRMVGSGFAGVVWGTQAAAAHMRGNGGGCIINIASAAAHLGIAHALLYCGIKAGVLGLTRAAATELGPDNIRVNAIAPSTVPTEGVLEKVSAATLENRVNRTPLRRLGTPEDIAGAAVFLAGPDAAFLTGQVVTMDGGMTFAFA